MGSKIKIRALGLILALTFSTGLPLLGQATGTISGTVQDTSGAVVPKSTITVTEVGTNFQRTVETNGAGQYVVPLLPAGNYEVRAQKTGFVSFLQKGIDLQANTQVEANAVLKPGGVTSQVTVNTTPALLQTASTSLVQVVESRRILDLPLNGRSVLDLVHLTAGVATSNVPTETQGTDLGNGGYQPGISLTGARGTSVNFLLDNVDFNETESDLPYPYPSPDAIKEFSVQMSTFSAQYGRAAGGVINAVTKSGTNQFHGDAYEFLRNYDFDAANYFSGRDALRQNQFGGTLGGPIWKNHTFFFFSYQGTRQNTSTPASVHSAPSEAMKAGDFSEWLQPGGKGQIYNPATGQPFPGNIIPLGLEDPVSAKILTQLPTSTSSNNYLVRFATAPNRNSENEYLIRVDQSIGERNRLWGRYFRFELNNPAVATGNLLYATNGDIGTYANFVGGYSRVFSPKWLNELDVSYGSENPVERTTAASPVVTLPSLGANVKNVPDANMLNISISGWAGINWGNKSLDYGGNSEVSDIVSYSNGRHDLHFGFEFRRYTPGFASYYKTNGNVSFNGQMTSKPGKVDAGNAYADFFLGEASSFVQTSLSHLHIVQPYYALFVQDNVRLTHKLTANLGLRWNPEPHPSENDNQWSTFVPGQQSTIFPNAPLGIVSYGDRGVGSVIRSKWNLWAPRIGFAYVLTPKTVVRTAYGFFYDEAMGLQFNTMIQSNPWVEAENLAGPVKYSDPYNGGPVLDPGNFTPTKDVTFPSYGSYTLPVSSWVPGDTQSWNLVVERQLSNSLVFRVGYVGSKGTHLTTGQDINGAIYGPGATSKNINQRRPIQGIGSLVLGMSNASSTYNALLVTLNQRFSHGFSILTSYTYSKSIDDSSTNRSNDNEGGPDPLDLSINRGPSDFDHTHHLVVSGVWQLPPLLGQEAFVRTIFGGWHANGIFSAHTGDPFTVASGVDTDLNGIGGDFADYTYTGWHLPGNRSKQAKINEWFDTSNFSVARTGTFGTGHRNQLRGPGYWNLDYSMFKDFPVKEIMHFELRGELFNALNHANLDDPNSNANSSAFGQITGASSPRIAQIALKLIF